MAKCKEKKCDHQAGFFGGGYCGGSSCAKGGNTEVRGLTGRVKLKTVNVSGAKSLNDSLEETDRLARLGPRQKKERDDRVKAYTSRS